ncbi:MAG: ABC transporter ATP-binding protein, partial [bacterium]|nr:ABC transporter ATP-binding protein [bacterium]
MLTLRNLKKFYKMGDTTVHALDGIELNIEKNEFVAVMG